MAYELNDVAGLDIVITVISGRGLVAKDKNLVTRKKTTSDVSNDILIERERGSENFIVRSGLCQNTELQLSLISFKSHMSKFTFTINATAQRDVSPRL